MSIKRRLSSASFKFVGLYVIVYLISTLGFILLILSILGNEIEDKIKNDIMRDYREITSRSNQDNTTDMETHIYELMEDKNPLETVFILKTNQGKTVVSNYPYETTLKHGWGYLAQMGIDTANAHDKGYVGWNAALGSYNLYIGRSVMRIQETKSIVMRIAILVIPISLLLAFLCGLIFNRIMTRRIDLINDHCRLIRTQGDLSLRMNNIRPDDEYGLLIANLNAMLDTIDKGVQNLQTVCDDVAHDLRTPLSRLKYRLESGLADSKANEKSLKSILKKALIETDSLLETFSAILRISQLNSGQRKSKFQNFDFLSVIETFYEAYAPSAEEAGHLLELKSNVSSCLINGDKEMIAQLIFNLIENALHHASGPDNKNLLIKLELICHNDRAILSVEDNGKGINANHRDQVFNKFFQSDYSRASSGNGLGLAIVKAVTDLHDAEIQLLTLNPGVKFLLSFPRLT